MTLKGKYDVLNPLQGSTMSAILCCFYNYRLSNLSSDFMKGFISAKWLSLVIAEHFSESSNRIFSIENQIINREGLVDKSLCSRTVKVELPVRVDFVGGWSDTPPWSLERAGCVLNMAITLDASLPIGTSIDTTIATGVSISDDAGNQLFIEDVTCIATPFDSNDPFRLVKSALLVTGIVHDKNLISMGLKIRTWANVPRGSGLGTSSILAAAVVKGLLQITDGDESNENVARLVLVLEQLMGTGGGWQDQIGGLYPGIKYTTSFPGVPLRLQVIPLLASPQLIRELQQRMLLVFTGQVSILFFYFFCFVFLFEGLTNRRFLNPIVYLLYNNNSESPGVFLNCLSIEFDFECEI